MTAIDSRIIDLSDQLATDLNDLDTEFLQMTSISGSLLFLAAALMAAQAAAADDVAGTIGPTNCRVVNPNPLPGERVSWSGACKDGFAHGAGVLEWFVEDVLGSRFRGTLAKGRPDGTGEYDYLRADARYEGEFREGRREGKGRLTEASGRVIAGNFDRGEPSGAVTVTGPGSYQYQGTWIKGQPNGQGRITYPDGGAYEGGFDRGLREGRGRLVDTFGTVYEGTFSAGELNGEGHVHMRDGFDYVGSLRNAKPHGRGVVVYNDGGRYDGEFAFGQREGSGSLTTPQGRKLKGQWLANQLNGPGLDELPDGERREGEFKAGLLAGKAQVSYPDGKTFSGGFQRGLRDGPGLEVAADGMRTEGRWTNGVLDRDFIQTTKDGRRIAQRAALFNAASCAPNSDDYPAASRRNNEQGTTRIRFMVDEAGKLTSAEILRSSGFARLDEVALSKLSNCTFRPGRDVDGQAIGGSFEIEYVWRLQ